MHEKEIEYFLKGLEFVKDEFYIDAINEFNKLISEFPNSELVDDAIYNIGLCYFNMNQFIKAIEYYQKIIDEYPEAQITVLGGGNEFGKTAAKAYYGIFNCYLALNDKSKLNDILEKLEMYKDSYVIIDNEKVSFKELALKSLSLYEKIQKGGKQNEF